MESSPASYQIVTDLLAEHTGQHLTENRRWRIGSALAGVFRKHGISNVDQLVCMLDQPDRRKSDNDLAQEVVEALLNNETYFFRDKPTFDQLPQDILPEIARRREDTKRISIWSAGCSTGQEVYSLAIAFAEQNRRWDGWQIDIFGTDVSSRAIAAARSGVYTQFEIQRGLGVAQMIKHFEETGEGWQISNTTRMPTRFQQHNVLNDPPSRKKFDLILCRNVLLYFDAATRDKAFSKLHSALASDGFLMLGAGENTIGQKCDFSPVAGRASVFQPYQVENEFQHALNG